jgi:hypothetical protein
LFSASAHATDGFLPLQDEKDFQNKVSVGFVVILATVVIIILFKKNEWFEDKWYFASTYQKTISIGIGVPLWLAIFAIMAEGVGYLVGGILIAISFAVMALHVSRWRRRKRIDSAYDRRSEPRDETSDHEEPSDREEESRRYSEEQDYEEPHADREEQYEEPKTSPTDMMLKKCYEILEVAENASPDEIKKAYKKLVKQWHPDSHRSKQRKEIAEREMKRINEAYEMLEKAGRVK